VSADKNKDAPAEEPGVPRSKRSKEKLIRLDDLIPQEKVTGGRQLFGTTETNQNQT